MNRDQAIQLPPVPELEYLYPPRPWHPKLTGYRVAVLALTTGFGLSKAVLAYRGESFAAITLEWVFSVVVFLAFVNTSSSPAKPIKTDILQTFLAGTP